MTLQQEEGEEFGLDEEEEPRCGTADLMALPRCLKASLV